MNKRLALLFLTAFLAAGCRQSVKPPKKDLAWVSIVYSGGKKCGPIDTFAPPDVKYVLGEAGIEVFKTAVQPYPVCANCGCPVYFAAHYALIFRADLPMAVKLGFAEAKPPAR